MQEVPAKSNALNGLRKVWFEPRGMRERFGAHRQEKNPCRSEELTRSLRCSAATVGFSRVNPNSPIFSNLGSRFICQTPLIYTHTHTHTYISSTAQQSISTNRFHTALADQSSEGARSHGTGGLYRYSTVDRRSKSGPPQPVYRPYR